LLNTKRNLPSLLSLAALLKARRHHVHVLAV